MDDFLTKAFKQGTIGNEILCPCQKCCNQFWKYRNVVREHLIVNGFLQGYNEWIFHRESLENKEPRSNDEGVDFLNNMNGILDDTFRNILEEDNLGIGEVPNVEEKKSFRVDERWKTRALSRM